jgi:hypothetical protein
MMKRLFYFLLILILFLGLATDARAYSDSFKLKISTGYYYGQQGEPVDRVFRVRTGFPKTFYVTVINISSNTQEFYEQAASSGYSSIVFEISDEHGNSNVIRRKKDTNASGAVISSHMNPGESKVFEINLNEDEWENVFTADKLMQSPRLYATFLLWMLSELFEQLPEVGDPQKPNLIFFFDEAHLLFEDVPKTIEEKIVCYADKLVDGDEEVPSKLWELVGPERMKSRGLDPKGLREYYRQRNLLKVQVTAEHVGNAVVFFASEATPTTGATLPIDGGIPAAFPR